MSDTIPLGYDRAPHRRRKPVRNAGWTARTTLEAATRGVLSRMARAVLLTGVTRSTRGATPMPRILSRGEYRRAGVQSAGARRLLRRPARFGHPAEIAFHATDLRHPEWARQHWVARAIGPTIKSEPRSVGATRA